MTKPKLPPTPTSRLRPRGRNKSAPAFALLVLAFQQRPGPRLFRELQRRLGNPATTARPPSRRD